MTDNTNWVNGGAMPKTDRTGVIRRDRRQFIGGSDARIIMGKDERALHRLWREKRGEVAVLDLSGVLIVQLGLVTEDLNRRWYEQNSGHRISDVQRHAIHRTILWMAATLDGLVKETGAVFEAKYMLPCSFSEKAAAEKHMAELQHNMLVATNSWAEFAGLFCETRQAHTEHERAKSELKGLMPEDAKEAMGHGIRAKRSKSGAVSFDLVEMEVCHASLQ
jgi:predicted phage-related endonuclease